MEIIASDEKTVTVKLPRPDVVALSVVLDGVTNRFGLDLEDELSSENIGQSRVIELCRFTRIHLNESANTWSERDMVKTRLPRYSGR